MLFGKRMTPIIRASVLGRVLCLVNVRRGISACIPPVHMSVAAVVVLCVRDNVHAIIEGKCEFSLMGLSVPTSYWFVRK